MLIFILVDVFWKRKACLLICCMKYKGFLLGGGRTVETIVGVWSVAWRLGIISAALFYSVEPAWHKTLCLHERFPLHKASKIKAYLSSLFISQRKCHFTLNVPQQGARGGHDYTLDRSPGHHRTHAWIPHWISTGGITFVMLLSGLRRRAAHLRSHFNWSDLWWHSEVKMQSHGFRRVQRRWVTIECWISTFFSPVKEFKTSHLFYSPLDLTSDLLRVSL